MFIQTTHLVQNPTFKVRFDIDKNLELGGNYLKGFVFEPATAQKTVYELKGMFLIVQGDFVQSSTERQYHWQPLFLWQGLTNTVNPSLGYKI